MVDEQSDMNKDDIEKSAEMPPQPPGTNEMSPESNQAGSAPNLEMPAMDFGKDDDVSAGAAPKFDKKVNPNDADEEDAEAAMLKMMEEAEKAAANKIVNPGDANEDDAEAAMLRMMEAENNGGFAKPTVEKMRFDNLDKSEKGETRNLNLLMDVSLPISIELGRTTMAIEDILNLGPGSVVELDKLAGEPVDLLVNNKLLAKGEVVVIDENFGVRITTMISKSERIRNLQ